MKKILSVIKTGFAISVLIIAFISCDKEFTTIGTDLISENDHYSDSSKVYSTIAYNKKINPVQTNGLASNLLGFYHDAIYGVSKASVVSQMNLSNVGQNTKFGVNIILDSVVLTVPYYSHVNADEPTDDDGNINYILDSVYGNDQGAMKLSVYRNDYYLSDFDPNSNFEDNQKYYSNGTTSGGGAIPVPEESNLLFEVSDFTLDASGIVLTTNDFDEEDEEEEEVLEKLEPSLRVVLKENEETQFWSELIFDKEGQSEISNTSNFKNYFRGLYFNLEELSTDGAMFMLNFNSSNANVTMYYKSINEFDDEDFDGIPDDADADVDNDGVIDEGFLDTDSDGIKDASDVDQTEGEDLNNDGIDDLSVPVYEKTVVLNFSGNRVNIFDNTYNTLIDDANNNSNDITGDEKLYLKGGEGSMAVINLFGGEDSDEFAEFMSHKDEWLINEANLIFYEDQTLVTEENHEDDRLYVYDMKNEIPVVDYYYDISSTTTPINSIINHLGRRKTDDSEVNKFKIRITEHINNILLKDSTNTKLGLVLSTNVNSIQNLEVSGAINEDDVSKVPSGAVLSPKGTILYGNNTLNSEKKVKLEIYYTEPNN